MVYSTFLLFQSCNIHSGTIYFESGTYVFPPEYFEEYEDTGFYEEETEEEDTGGIDYSAEKETFALVVDLESLTAQITGTSFDTTLTLKERAERDWRDQCPMQMSTTYVQTVDIVEDFTLWDSAHSSAYLHADDCFGETRTTEYIILGKDSYQIFRLIKQ